MRVCIHVTGDRRKKVQVDCIWHHSRYLCLCASLLNNPNNLHAVMQHARFWRLFVVVSCANFILCIFALACVWFVSTSALIYPVYTFLGHCHRSHSKWLYTGIQKNHLPLHNLQVCNGRNFFQVYTFEYLSQWLLFISNFSFFWWLNSTKSSITN